jgi:hypothetical protein
LKKILIFVVKNRNDEKIPETFELEYDHLIVGVGSVNK